MGYTHYFTNVEWEILAFHSVTLFQKAAEMDIKLAGPSGELGTHPVINIIEDPYIAFNGVGDDSHENMIIVKAGRGFQFCKTVQKDYDIIAVAILHLVACINAEIFELRSDGGLTDDELLPGIKLAQEVRQIHGLAFPSNLLELWG